MAASNPRKTGAIRVFAVVLGFPLLAVAIVTGAEAFLSNSVANRAEATELAEPGFGPHTFNEALVRASHSVEYHRSRVALAEDEWLRREGLARSLHRRSQLTGSFADLAEAAAETQRGMALAPVGSGPMLTWATIAMSSHDLDQSASALARLEKVAVSPKPAVESEIALLRGDLSFYRGDRFGAASAYRQAETIAPSAGSAIRLARLAKSAGDFEAAKAWLVRSSARSTAVTPHLIATLELQLGAIELARGEYAAAQARFEKAERAFPGHWLIEAHLAQSQALEGDLDGAIEKMRELAIRTQSPDLMDSLANMLRATVHQKESGQWIARSAEIWNVRMQRLPEAAIGHALEHELAFGAPEGAILLARRNLAIRPYGGAQLLMAQAYRKAGKFDRARVHIEKAKAVGLRSAALYASESEILTVLGDLQAARSAREQARALNPRIFDPETAFIWFSHG